jgi:hypothetical protein
MLVLAGWAGISTGARAQSELLIECHDEAAALRNNPIVARTDSIHLVLHLDKGPRVFRDSLGPPGDPPAAQFVYCGYEPHTAMHFIARVGETVDGGFLVNQHTGAVLHAGKSVLFSPLRDQYFSVVQPDGLDGEEWHLYRIDGMELWKGFSFLPVFRKDLGYETSYADLSHPRWVNGAVVVTATCLLTSQPASRKVGTVDLTLRNDAGKYDWSPPKACRRPSP